MFGWCVASVCLYNGWSSGFKLNCTAMQCSKCMLRWGYEHLPIGSGVSSEADCNRRIEGQNIAQVVFNDSVSF